MSSIYAHSPFRRVVTIRDDTGRSIVRSSDPLPPTRIASGDAACKPGWTTEPVAADLTGKVMADILS